jgi:uncharacterized membrane protein YfcA
MEIVIALTAFAASLLTLFSGFGLGTLLTPVFSLFFPVPTAIALTGVVHLLNNLFKLSLLGRHASQKIVLHFGIPSVLGGAAGATALLYFHDAPAWGSWESLGKVFEFRPVKIILGIVMAFFALFELIPALKRLQFPNRYIPWGGLLSGFFGGLSGHQGALRSAFLLKAGLEKQSFVATGVVIACMVDLTRIPVYYAGFLKTSLFEQWGLLALTTCSAFAGAWMGSRYLQKTTVGFVQTLTAVLIMLLSVLLALGII